MDELNPILKKLQREKNSIETEMDKVDQSLITIKAQILEAQANASAKKEFSDPTWWRRVNSASKYKGLQRQKLQRSLGDINSQIKLCNSGAFERLFISFARELLDEETFASILDQVRERQADISLEFGESERDEADARHRH